MKYQIILTIILTINCLSFSQTIDLTSSYTIQEKSLDLFNPRSAYAINSSVILRSTEDNYSSSSTLPQYISFSPDPIHVDKEPLYQMKDFCSLQTGLNPLYLADGRGEGVTIAILSSGVAEEVISSQSFAGGTCTLDPTPVSDVDPWRDNVGHGTALASVLVDPDYGIVPEARLLNVKVFTGSTTAEGYDEIEGNYSTTAAGIEWVRENFPETDIILIGVPSFGGLDDLLSIRVAQATDQGILVVAPVGNYGPRYGSIMSPACSPLVLSVGAADVLEFPIKEEIWAFSPHNRWQAADFSGRGPTSGFGTGPDLIAPGVDSSVKIPVCYNQTIRTGRRLMSGTGAAAAYVAGGIAALYSIFYQNNLPRIRDPLGVKIALKNTAQWLSYPGCSTAVQGEGLVQFAEAWKLLDSTKQVDLTNSITTFDLQGSYPRHSLGEPWLPFLTDFSPSLVGEWNKDVYSSGLVAFSGQEIRIPFLSFTAKGAQVNNFTTLDTFLKIPASGNYPFYNYPYERWWWGSDVASFKQLQKLVVHYKFAETPIPYFVNETWVVNTDGEDIASIAFECLVVLPQGQIGLDYSKDKDGYWEQDSFEGKYFGWRKVLAEQVICSQPLYNLSDWSKMAVNDVIVLADPEIPLTKLEENILTELSQRNRSILLLLDNNDGLHSPFLAPSRSTQYYDTHHYYHELLTTMDIGTTPYERWTDDERVYPGLGAREMGIFSYSISYVTTASQWRDISFNSAKNVVYMPMRGYTLKDQSNKGITAPLVGRDLEHDLELFSLVTFWKNDESNGLFVVSGTDAPFSLVSNDYNPLDLLAFYWQNCSVLVNSFSHFLLSPRFSSNLQVKVNWFPSIFLDQLSVEICIQQRNNEIFVDPSMNGMIAVYYGDLETSSEIIWSGPFLVVNGVSTIPLPEFYSGPITVLIRIQSDTLGKQWFVYSYRVEHPPFIFHLLLVLGLGGIIGVAVLIYFWKNIRIFIFERPTYVCPYCLCAAKPSVSCEYCHRTISSQEEVNKQ